jgi:hypothetical protein
MGNILTGFEFMAAKPKRQSQDAEDVPIQESMRGSRTLMSNPSTDQKRVRRTLTRKASLDGREVTVEAVSCDDLWSTAADTDMGTSRSKKAEVLLKCPACGTTNVDRMEIGPFRNAAPASVRSTCKDCGKIWSSLDTINSQDAPVRAKNSSIDYREAAEALDDRSRFTGSLQNAYTAQFGYESDDDHGNYDEDQETIESWDPDGGESQPTDADYANFKAKVVRAFGQDAWDKYNRQGRYEASLHTAFMSDFQSVRSSAQALNGYGAVVTYNGDTGMQHAVGKIDYDGNSVKVYNLYGRLLDIPIAQVLGIEETTSDQYPQKPIDQAFVDQDQADNRFNLVAPIVHGLFPSGFTGSNREAYTPMGPKDGVPDMPHAMDDMIHDFYETHPTKPKEPETKTSAVQDFLGSLIAKNEALIAQLPKGNLSA